MCWLIKQFVRMQSTKQGTTTTFTVCTDGLNQVLPSSKTIKSVLNYYYDYYSIVDYSCFLVLLNVIH